VAKIREFYLESGETMFAKAGLLRPSLQVRRRAPRGEAPAGLRGATTLGPKRCDPAARRDAHVSTDSPWPVSNNPGAKYNARDRKDCNLDLPLWQLSARARAPVYFRRVVTVGQHRFVFVDGGVTMYNNPALILFVMATLEPYKLQGPPENASCCSCPWKGSAADATPTSGRRA